MQNMGKDKFNPVKGLNQKEEIRNKTKSVDFDIHLYRRVFHTAAASFLIYYSLPNEGFISILKFYLPILIVGIALLIEFFRIKGKLNRSHFFRLRSYEEKRPASYIYFGIAILFLLLFFPQQISIPCILCACFSDPIIGELRERFGKKNTYVLGFFVCMFFFLVTWYKAEIWIIFSVSIIGGLGALIGEIKKFWFIDDDFMIQILPAILILILWQVLKLIGLNIMPSELIISI